MELAFVFFWAGLTHPERIHEDGDISHSSLGIKFKDYDCIYDVHADRCYKALPTSLILGFVASVQSHRIAPPPSQLFLNFAPKSF